jgi:hypothetical protein
VRPLRLCQKSDQDLHCGGHHYCASDPASTQQVAQRPAHQPYLPGGSRVARAEAAHTGQEQPHRRYNEAETSAYAVLQPLPATRLLPFSVRALAHVCSDLLRRVLYPYHMGGSKLQGFAEMVLDLLSLLSSPDTGEISPQAMRRIERNLDLEEEPRIGG